MLDVVAADLGGLGSLLDESADLRRVIRSPVISREDQGQALGAIGKRAGFAELTTKFLGLLAEHRRLFALPEIFKAYGAMLAEHKGEVGAELVSAVPLSEDQVAKVKDQLSSTIGKQITLSARVDPACSAGWSCASARACSTRRFEPSCASSSWS